ncbi:MAG: AmmeMemoRadiSam system protein B [Desulfuromonadales bacterium]|nr:AmmeMemoRadiSam system protein B [Desulfuromonadales bacterium]
MIRPAVVAGQFYSGQKESLLKSVESLMPTMVCKQSAIGLMSPHAGYIYSGSVAGQTFSAVKIPDEVIILGPNHHGRGHLAAVYASGSWETPLGQTKIASELAELILAECPMTANDSVAHLPEHSLEVQLPFLQFLAPQTSIVPICISHLPLAILLQLGDGLARAVTARGSTSPDSRPLIVASTDMTHYEAGEVAREKDFLALEKVLALDPEGLYEVVQEHRISMCGVLPTVVMLQAALALGATNAELVAYSNSGDVTGDQSEVVGYAGVRVF